MQCEDHSLHVWPALFKLFQFFQVPCADFFGRILARMLRRLVEECSRKVHNEWRFHDAHFNRQQFVIEENQQGDRKAGNILNSRHSQAKVGIPLPDVKWFPFQKLDSRLPIRTKNVTIKAKSKAPFEDDVMPLRERRRSFLKITG